jgi:hypothetical protein
MDTKSARRAVMALSMVALLIEAPAMAAETDAVNPREAAQIGIEAVIYGMPLVVMDVTKRVQTNVAEAQTNGRAPVNQFGHMLKYPTADYRDVIRMNVDTLYSLAWLDLTREPMVLSVPDTQGRFYLMPLFDAWTNVFASPGKRTTGTSAGNYAVTGPTWKGTLPDGVTEIKAPTNIVWIIGRTQANGPADYKAANAIQKQFKLTPLSTFGKPETPAVKSIIDPQLDMKTPPAEQVSQMSADAFFKSLAALMKTNPPTTADAPMLAKLAKIGIAPGQEFDMNRLDPQVARALEKSVETTVGLLRVAMKAVDRSTCNGWCVPPMNVASFGTDYGVRAVCALEGLGINLPQDAVYPIRFLDRDGKPLNGKSRYVLHFDKGKTPPANAFWSLTMYNAQGFFVANPINRQALSAWMPLKYNEDGSLDLYLQTDSPGKERESNWLPAASGDFNMVMRIYWPKESVLGGKWKPPEVTRAGP